MGSCSFVTAHPAAGGSMMHQDRVTTSSVHNNTGREGTKRMVVSRASSGKSFHACRLFEDHKVLAFHGICRGSRRRILVARGTGHRKRARGGTWSHSDDEWSKEEFMTMRRGDRCHSHSFRRSFAFLRVLGQSNASYPCSLPQY